MPTHHILPLPGYTPTIGRLVAMLTYARQTTFAAVDGLAREQLSIVTFVIRGWHGSVLTP